MIMMLDPQQARRVFSTRPPSIREVRLAMLFKSPRAIDRLLGDEFVEQLDDGGSDAAEIRRLLDGLVADQALVPMPQASPQAERAGYASEVASISALLQSVAGDLAAMGPWAGKHVDVDGAAPADCLSDIHARLKALRDALAQSQPRFVAEQIQATPGASERELKIHLGCGPHAIAGWINVDLWHGDIRLNLSRPLPFADGAARFVYAAHLFEHLNFHTEAPRLAREMHRVLAPGGVLRLAVPDMEAYVREYASGNDAFFAACDRQRPEFGSPAGYATPLAKVMFMGGSAARAGSFFEHQMGYDLDTLSQVLLAAGFSRIERRAHGDTAHDALREVDASSAATGLNFDGIGHSLIVEAIR